MCCWLGIEGPCVFSKMRFVALGCFDDSTLTIEYDVETGLTGPVTSIVRPWWHARTQGTACFEEDYLVALYADEGKM